MNEEFKDKITFWEFCDKYYWGFVLSFILGIIYFPDQFSSGFGKIFYMGGGVVVVTSFLFVGLLTVKRYWREIMDAIFGYARVYDNNEEAVTANQIMNMVFSDECTISAFSQVMPQKKAQKVLSVLNKMQFRVYRVLSDGTIDPGLMKHQIPLLVKDRLNKNRTTFNAALLQATSETGKPYTKDQIKREVIPILQDVL